jgi:hypothetical protein
VELYVNSGIKYFLVRRPNRRLQWKDKMTIQEKIEATVASFAWLVMGVGFLWGSYSLRHLWQTRNILLLCALGALYIAGIIIGHAFQKCIRSKQIDQNTIEIQEA